MVQRFGRTPSLLWCWKDNDETNNNNDLENNLPPPPRSPIVVAATMQSPLPDSTALEAGILEDTRPSRLSRVQDNVRVLLRTSVFGAPSVKSSPTTPIHPHAPQVITSPTGIHPQPEILPSPASTTSTLPTHYTSSPNPTPQDPCANYRASVHQMADQSTLFNARAVAALNHPDLSDPSLATFSQQKTLSKQRSTGWTRSKKGKRAARKAAGSRKVMCCMSALLLGALVAIYISIATTTTDLSTTFHILFVLGICLATIVFAYSVIQLFFIGKRSKTQPPLFIAVSRHGHQRRHRHNHHHSQRHPQPQRSMPTLTGESDFVPSIPIQVHLSTDDVRSDPLIAHPTAGAQVTSDETWDKDAHELPNPPPPAYGRWRNSVRANPDLLHWQAVPEPVSPGTPVLPSPTYEEAMAEARNGEGGPPSYATRESPARRREVREARAGIASSVGVVEPEPEMVEVRGGEREGGVGVGLAI